jgi:hypothetical protein
VYNIDETGVMLSMLGSIKVLIGRDHLRGNRGTITKRTIVTTIECICNGLGPESPRLRKNLGFGTGTQRRPATVQQIAELPGTLEILRTTTKAFRNGKGLQSGSLWLR